MGKTGRDIGAEMVRFALKINGIVLLQSGGEYFALQYGLCVGGDAGAVVGSAACDPQYFFLVAHYELSHFAFRRYFLVFQKIVYEFASAHSERYETVSAFYGAYDERQFYFLHIKKRVLGVAQNVGGGNLRLR